MEREVRRDLTEMAERHAVDVFARNLRSLLLQPPIPKQVVLAIDPGFRTGCKVAVLDGHGNLLDHGVDPPAPAPEPPVTRRRSSSRTSSASTRSASSPSATAPPAARPRS